MHLSINNTIKKILPLKLAWRYAVDREGLGAMIRLTPDMMAEGADCWEGDSPACSTEEPNNTSTPRPILQFRLNASEQKHKTPKSGQVYVCKIDLRIAVCVEDKSRLKAAEISLLARALAEAAKRNLTFCLCPRGVSTATISYALVFLNTVNVFIR